MSMLKEFKQFAVKGNVVDLTIGVIVGTAFTKVVTSIVNDILMPPIGRLLGNVDFSDLYINLSGGTYPSLAVAKQAGAATINYGLFLNNVIDFLIIALVTFLMVRQLNNFKKKEEGKQDDPATKDCLYCLSSIPVKATKCAHCTADLPQTSAS